MFLKARWVLPVSSPPIENGIVSVEDNRIAYVGKDLRGLGEVDLGDATILPGLVNAHAHLEFSKSGSKGSFTEWARSMAHHPERDDTGPRLRRLLETGTTTVADHCSPEISEYETPLRRISLWEVLGAEKDRAAASLARARKRASEGGFVTPHSLYAVHEDALRECLDDGPGLRSLHVLESADEDEFFRRGRGPLAEFVREMGGAAPLPMSIVGRLPQRALVIHGNYLNPTEIGALSPLEASVIHCPGSHRFFGHKRFPYQALRAAGVRVALGTDSLASNEDLSMLREMRLFRDAYPDVPTEEILRMATLKGAAALGMDKDVGSIEVGKKADLIAVPGEDILKAERVVFSMIDGKICLNR